MKILGGNTKKMNDKQNVNSGNTETVNKKVKNAKAGKTKKDAELVKNKSVKKIDKSNRKKTASDVKNKKNKKIQDIHKMTIIKGIHDDLIDYGTYFGAAIEIPSIEFRFFSPHRRTNSIDVALANVIRSVGARYSANLVKIERPLMMDQYIETEMQKIEMLKKSFEHGVFNEQELRARVELICERLEVLNNMNEEDLILVPHYYLVLFDSDKRQLENQVRTALTSLKGGEMDPKRLNDKELAVFLRYTNSVDFNERDIETVEPEDYVDYFMPDTLEFKQKTVEVNNIITHNFRVSRYPLEVSDAWGAALFDIPGTKVVIKFSQMDHDKSVRAIDRSIGELQSQWSSTGVSSKVIELETHIETLSSLLLMLQNNNESLIAMNMYVTAYDIATTRESKTIIHQPPLSNLPRISGMKKDIKRAFTEVGFRLNDQSFMQLETYVGCQVNGYDPFLKSARGVPGSTLAGVFPWIFASLRDRNGVCLGSADGVPTFLDFFRRDNERVNSNMVIVGKSGGGKSYATKSILSNLAADDSKIFVLDPENEYADLASNLNGKFINVANASHGRINPFHIITSLEDDEAEEGLETNSFSEHLQFLEEFFRQILPEVNSDAMEYLNNLINRVYMRCGIDQYTNLNTLKAEDYPTFDNLYDCILEEFQNTQSEYLRNNLRVLMSYVAKFSTGGRNSNMWNGPSTLSTVENFIVFNFQSLLANRNNTIANAQMLLVLKYLDNEIIKNREYNTKYGANRKIIIVIDEAHVFIDSKYPLALDFMYQMAKRIRKYNGMQIVITQNIKDFVGSEELARKSTAIINACQYSFIFSLAPNDMHDLCKLYEKAGGINEIEQEQIMAAPRGRAFVVTGPTSRATIQIETPKPIEQMFSQPGFQGRFYAGRPDEWDEFVGESRMIRAAEMLNGSEDDLWEAEDDNLPNFRSSGVQFIEVEMEETSEKDDAEDDVLIEEVVEKPSKPEAPPRRENATNRALELIHEEAAQAAQNMNLGVNTAGGMFSPAHLQQLGFEALMGEIRRAVREEVKAEYDVKSADNIKAASAAKSKDAVQVMSSAALVHTTDTPEEDSESFDDIFNDLFSDDGDVREDYEEIGNDDEEQKSEEDFDDIFDELFSGGGDAQDDYEESDDEESNSESNFDDIFVELFGDVKIEEGNKTSEDDYDDYVEEDNGELEDFNDIFDDLFREDFNLDGDSELEESSEGQKSDKEGDDDFFTSLWDFDDDEEEEGEEEEEEEEEEKPSKPKRKVHHGEELDLDSIHELEDDEEEEYDEDDEGGQEEGTSETKKAAGGKRQSNELVYEITLDELLEMKD